MKNNGSIQTFGNKCFVEREVVDQPLPVTRISRTKPEKVNLKLGKIRVQVTNAKKVRVFQDGNAMVILLEELPSSGNS